MPPEQVERTLAAVIEEARAWTRGLVELPDGEGVVLEIVRDKPWWASCDYLGDLRSRIAVNVDLPMSAVELLVLAIHETYPGHHTERCCKEHLLVAAAGCSRRRSCRGRRRSRSSRRDREARAALLEATAAGSRRRARRRIELDLAHALAVERALEPCRWAEVNAALMLHEHGAEEAEVRAYLERWGLVSAELRPI